MDEDTLLGAMEILHLVKVMDDHDRLPALLKLVGNDLELTLDNQGLVEICACQTVFQDTRVYQQCEGKIVSRYEYEEDREVFVLRDPLLTRFDALCREYEARRGIPKTENAFARQMEGDIHRALQFSGNYCYDYLLVDGTQDRKGPKIVLFFFEEFCSYDEVPVGLCEVLDACKYGIDQLEKELNKLPAKVIPMPLPLVPEEKEAA